MKVLIVEDDELVLAFIANTLVEHGHDFDVARSGTWGLAAADAGDHDVIVLDLNLPDITGFEVAERHRERGNQTPILMLTARSAESGVIRGLNVGADDYVTKPCKRGELLAWLRALARRRSPTGNAMLQYDDLDVDRINNRVRRAGQEIDRTPVEFKLLTALVLLDGHIASRDFLNEQLWGTSAGTSSSLLSVHVTHLRSKLSVVGEVDLIETVRGVGYRLRARA